MTVTAIFALALFIVAIDTTKFAVLMIDLGGLDNYLIWDPVECDVATLETDLPIL